MKTSLKNLLDKSNNVTYSFADEFNTIIEYQIDGYDGKTKDKLKSFFYDLQKGGCMSGIIGDFIYHSDCKNFYIKHIEDLEDFKEELEDQLGEPIQNRHKIVHYTFVVWLCFEEYCYDLYNTIFEN
jgi:hypothetical protein